MHVNVPLKERHRPTALAPIPSRQLALLAMLYLSGLQVAGAKTTIPIVPDSGGIPTLETIVVTADRLQNSFGGIAGVDPIGTGIWANERRNNDLFEPNPTQPEESAAPNPGTRCPESGNPVVLANGNKIETEIDFTSNGDMPLTMKRTWNGYSFGRDHMFESWDTIFDNRIKFTGCPQSPGSTECTADAGSTIWAKRSDGSSLKFAKGSDGTYYEIKPGPVSAIIRNPDKTWILFTEDRKVERYTASGFIKEIKNEQGIGWAFTYGGANNTLLQRVTHTSGRYIEFTWQPLVYSSSGYRVSQVRTPGGAYVTYTYTNDAYERLKTVTLPGTPAMSITYHYSGEPGESSSAGIGPLTGKSINGRRYSTFSYDPQGRAIATAHAGNVERFGFAYTEGAGGELTTVETNPLGKKATYKFKNEKLLSITGQASANCAASFRDITYDANGYKDTATDFEGNLVDYSYDSHGHLLKKVEAYGEPSARTTEFGWDEVTNRLTRVSVLGLHETVYRYLPNGRASSIEVKNLSGNGVANQVQKTTYTYALHSNGLVATMKVDGPIAGSTDVSITTFSSAGDVISTENGLGHKTTFTNYNGYGQPGTVVGPNGDRTDFVYDAIGRLLEERAHRAGVIRTTLYKYDGFGRIASITYPDGVKHGYQYDLAGRLLSEYVPEGGGLYAQKVYTYNAMSLPIAEEIRRISFEPAQGTVQ